MSDGWIPPSVGPRDGPDATQALPVAPPSAWPSTPPPEAVAPTPSPPPKGRGRVVTVVALAVIAVALVAVAIVAAVRTDDLDDAAPTTTTAPPTTAAPAPPTPTLPDLGLGGPDPAELARPLDEVLPEIITFVERQRGHTFLEEPVVEAVPEEEFESRLAEAQEAEAAALAEQEVQLEALGIIPPDTDLVELTTRLGAAGVLGFYQPGDGTLLVKGDVITPLVQTVIAHELTHALDDQLWDLTRIEDLAEAPDESAFGLTSVVEGTARWVEQAFEEQLDPDEQAAIERERLSLGLDQSMELFDVPPALLISSQIPYGNGADLVRAVLAEADIAGLDAAVVDPPTTSEQVLAPDAFLAREPAAAVPAPAAEGPVVSEGAYGAVDLRILELVGDPFSLIGPAASGVVGPVEGFGGGRYVTWQEGGRSCVAIHLAGDDADGDQVIRTILDDWSASGVTDVSVGEGPAGPGGRPVISVRSCTP